MPPSPLTFTCKMAYYSPEFKSQVSKLMHAFGDVEDPLDASVECMCGLLTQFLDDTLMRAVEVALTKKRFDAECLLFTCIHDKAAFKAAKNKLDRKRALGLALGGDMTK